MLSKLSRPLEYSGLKQLKISNVTDIPRNKEARTMEALSKQLNTYH